MAATGAYDEIEKVTANCNLQDNLQHASTSSTQSDKAPVYDSDGSAERGRDGAGGWRVVASGVVDLVDRDGRSVFGVCRKSSPEKFSSSGGGGRRRRVTWLWWWWQRGGDGGGGWRVVASGMVDLVDRDGRSVFGVRRKSSPEKFSGGDGGGQRNGTSWKMDTHEGLKNLSQMVKMTSENAVTPAEPHSEGKEDAATWDGARAHGEVGLGALVLFRCVCVYRRGCRGWGRFGGKGC
nr:hypothetical protein [Tanacetum cinerariifolium]